MKIVITILVPTNVLYASHINVCDTVYYRVHLHK